MRSIVDNKKGDFTGVLYLIASISAFAIFLLIIGYIAVEVSDKVETKLGSDVKEVNDSFQATTNVAENTLSTIWYVMFGGLILGLLITAWYMPTHPVMVAPFIILLIIAIILGVAMSNSYEKLHDVEQLEDTADSQSSIYFMMSNLPYIALVIGVIGMIITFAKPGGQGAPIG